MPEHDSAANEPRALRTFAEKLDYLWAHVYPPEPGRPYTYREAATKINEMRIGADQAVEDGSTPTQLPVPVVSVTHGYLQQLRTGERTDPKASYIVALSRLFGVPTSYFFDDEVTADFQRQIAELAQIRDSIKQSRDEAPDPASVVALRANGLSPQSMKAVLGLIANLRDIEGLPPPGRPRGEE